MPQSGADAMPFDGCSALDRYLCGVPGGLDEGADQRGVAGAAPHRRARQDRSVGVGHEGEVPALPVLPADRDRSAANCQGRVAE